MIKVVKKRTFTEPTKVVDLQIKDTHNFAIGKDKIIVHNSYIRPRGAFIDGVGIETPGSVKFLELFDKASDVITSGSGRESVNKKGKGKIRKGAMMSVLDCITGNTPINTLSGKIPIKELVGQRPYLYCTDGEGNVLVRQSLLVWSKGVRKTIRVVFDNDEYIECTPDHLFMLKDGSFEKAKNLTFGESLYDGFGGWASENFNHKVVRIEECGEQEVFDISMPDPYHNFVANDVFIHNCWHPDIEEFIRAKQSGGRLTKFNMSVNCTDKFMKQLIEVKNHTEAIESIENSDEEEFLILELPNGESRVLGINDMVTTENRGVIRAIDLTEDDIVN